MIRKAADQLQPGDVWLRGTKPLRVTKVADGKAAGWLAIHAVAPDGHAAVRRLLREASVKIIDPANGQLSAEAAAFVLRPAAPSPPAKRSVLSHRVLHLEARVAELTRHVEDLSRRSASENLTHLAAEAIRREAEPRPSRRSANPAGRYRAQREHLTNERELRCLSLTQEGAPRGGPQPEPAPGGHGCKENRRR